MDEGVALPITVVDVLTSWVKALRFLYQGSVFQMLSLYEGWNKDQHYKDEN